MTLGRCSASLSLGFSPWDQHHSGPFWEGQERPGAEQIQGPAGVTAEVLCP